MVSFFHDLFAWAPVGIPAFIFVIAFVVIIHELGHFLVARACGVAVEAFSIGFGGEIVGWTDKKSTRWKLCWLPLGGYVKFAGDENAASIPNPARIAQMSAAERAGAFPLKPLWQRVLVVLAGPTANFLLAFAIFTLLFAFSGVRVLSTYVGLVEKDSAAYAAGIKPGDRITAVDGKAMTRFDTDLVSAIRDSKAKSLTISLDRAGTALDVVVTPRIRDGRRSIGVAPDPSPERLAAQSVGLVEAPLLAAQQCYGIVYTSLNYVWRIVSQKESGKQLGGPILIAQAAKSAASTGIYTLFYLIAVISVSIGLINLFPIPLLDGGHLLYYAFEGVLGRPLNERIQDVGFRFGLALVLGLMIFSTWNDLVR